MGLLFVLSASILFGLTNVAIAQAGKALNVNRFEGLLITLVVNNIMNFTLILLLHRTLLDYNLVGILYFIGSGILTSFLGRLLLYQSIGLIGASRAGSIKITTPLFTLVLGITVLNERFGILNLLGIFIVVGGVFFVTSDTSAVFINRPEVQSVDSKNCIDDLEPSNIYKRGILIGLAAGLSLALGNIFTKLGLLNYPAPLIGAAIGSATSLICLWTLHLACPRKIIFNKISTLLSTPDSRFYILAGIFSSLAIYSILYSLMYLSVSIVTVLISIEALFTIIFSWLILKKREVITWKLIIGTVIIIVGIANIVLL